MLIFGAVWLIALQMLIFGAVGLQIRPSGAQEQMIEKLKAYKQSVITEAVTKGLHALHARADMQSARNEYKHLQCETSQADYKSLYSKRSDYKSDRAKTAKHWVFGVDSYI